MNPSALAVSAWIVPTLIHYRKMKWVNTKEEETLPVTESLFRAFSCINSVSVAMMDWMRL